MSGAEFYWRVAPLMVGLTAVLVGELFTLRALYHGHGSTVDYYVSAIALAVEAGALMILIVRHIYEMTPNQIVAWAGVGITIVYVTFVGLAIANR